MAQKSEDLDIMKKELDQTRRDIISMQQNKRRQNQVRVGHAENPSKSVLEIAALIVFLENGDFTAATAFLSVSASKAARSLSPKPKKTGGKVPPDTLKPPAQRAPHSGWNVCAIGGPGGASQIPIRLHMVLDRQQPD